MSDVDEKPEVVIARGGGPGEGARARQETRPAAEAGSIAHATERQQTLGPRIVLGAFLLAGLGALGIYLALRPDGEPVGDVDLLDSGAALVVDGAPGDVLTFTSRITTGLGAYDGSSWKSRSNDATRAMKSSSLTVIVVGPDGAEQTSRCPLWGGSMSSDRPDEEHLTENGVINDCAVDLQSAGEHSVRARVQWDGTLAIGEARLTAYRERAAR